MHCVPDSILEEGRFMLPVQLVHTLALEQALQFTGQLTAQALPHSTHYAAAVLLYPDGQPHNSDGIRICWLSWLSTHRVQTVALEHCEQFNGHTEQFAVFVS
jgi:hypothetical protein